MYRYGVDRGYIVRGKKMDGRGGKMHGVEGVEGVEVKGLV